MPMLVILNGSGARADDAADAARCCEEAVESMSGFGRYCRKSHRTRTVECEIEANESEQMSF
jgi:hypothetical protein